MRIASGLRGRARINLSPLGGEARLLGQSIVEQDRELLGFQWVERRVLIFGPPANATLRKPAGEQIEADAVVTQHFEGRAAAISEDKERTGERIFRQLALAKRGKPIDPITEVDRLAGEKDPELRNELNH